MLFQNTILKFDFSVRRFQNVILKSQTHCKISFESNVDFKKNNSLTN